MRQMLSHRKNSVAVTYARVGTPLPTYGGGKKFFDDVPR